MERNNIRVVKKVGELSGYCREYYQDIHTGQFFIRQEDWPDQFNWYTTDKLWGEPEYKVKDEIKFVPHNNLEMEF